MAASPPAALVTGSTAGIGRELAVLLARDGYDLVLVARTVSALEELAWQLEREHGIRTLVVSQDLSADRAAERVREAVRSAGLSISCLINNAGAGLFGEFSSLDLDRMRQLIALNVTSLVELTRLFLSDLEASPGGKILNVASVAAFLPGPLHALYYASKAFVLSFSEALREELEPVGITVSVLCPGPTLTEFQRRAGVGRSRVTDWLVMDARTVATAGYAGLKQGQSIIIPGVGNKVIPQLVRLLPRRTVAALSARGARSRRGKPPRS